MASQLPQIKVKNINFNEFTRISEKTEEKSCFSRELRMEIFLIYKYKTSQNIKFREVIILN